jgi:hypothetical protein
MGKMVEEMQSVYIKGAGLENERRIHSGLEQKDYWTSTHESILVHDSGQHIRSLVSY